MGSIHSSLVGIVFAAAAVWSLPAMSAEANSKILVGASSLPPGLGNPYAGSGPPGIYTYTIVFDALTFVDIKGDTEPRLSSGWKLSDPTHWIFTLKQGVKFSNGEALTSKAVVDSINWLLSEAGKGTPVAGEIRSVESVRAIDDFNVEITTKGPRPTLPRELAGTWIVAPKAWADLGVEGFAAKPVGTGSFQITSFEKDRAEMVAFPGSWRAPKEEALTLFAIPDTAARASALVSDQLHIAVDMSPDQIPQIESGGALVDIVQAPRVMGVSLISVDDSPIQHVAVRRAMNHAVNKKLIVDELLRGLGQPASQMATPNAFGYNPNLQPYEYDPDKAKKLLSEAGFPNGFDMKMEVIVGSFPADREIYSQVAQDLGKVGIHVEMAQVPFSQWLKAFLGGEKGKRIGFEGQAFNLGAQVSPDLDGLRGFQYASCRKETPFYCNPAEVELIEKAEREFDLDRRRQLIREALKVNHDGAPIIFIAEMVDLVGVSSKLKNFENVNRFFSYDRMTLAN